MKNYSRAIVLAALTALLATPAIAGELQLTMQDGRVTLIAQDVPLRQILAEWARVGRTTIVNADKVTGPALTLQLIDVPERQALDILLRSASGYVAAQRASVEPGASLFDRVMILPTSRPPAQSAAATPPPSFNRPTLGAPTPIPADEDEEPADTPVMPPGAAPPQMGVQPAVPGFQPGGPGPAGVQGAPQTMPSTRPGTPGPTVRPPGPGGGGTSDMQPGAPDYPQPNPAGQQPVLTAPRPGMLPPPPAAPYVPGGPNPAGRGGQPGAKPGGPGGPGGE